MSRAPKKVLIVDDEHDAGLTLKIVLEKYGFLVDYFTDPSTALTNYRPDVYDLIILDIRMQELNGFQLYNQLKSKDPKMKTLFLTALSSVEHYNIEGNKVYPMKGLRHFCKKPISNHDLLEQVYLLTN
jgi:two-component system catabolic regulation response regulator CreB/two-component system response regulator ChvI